MPLKYAGIRVRDLERSVRFYTALGLVEEKAGRQHGAWILLRDPASGQRLELNWYEKGSPFDAPYVPGEGLDHLGFEVDDARAWHDKMVGLGARSALAPWEESPGEWVAYVEDPDGNWVEFFSYAPPV